MNPDITKMSVTELKALCYDHMALIDNSNKAIQIINQEITRKLQNPTPVVSGIEPAAEVVNG